MNPTTRWRDRNGNFHYLDEMTTLYVYNTAKCVWNNVLGQPRPFGEVVSHVFDREDYPMDTLRAVFHACIEELRTRRDTTPEMRDFLTHVSQ